MVVVDEQLEQGRQRLWQVFQFLNDFNTLRNPVRTSLDEQLFTIGLDDLPDIVARLDGTDRELRHSTASATLPMSTRRTPERPGVPMTIAVAVAVLSTADARRSETGRQRTTR